uniref:Uncharacterized protein n=1 Tax=Phlebotomus papatasi TaxID=29031 RepID=A0A1B0GM89_PHLPP
MPQQHHLVPQWPIAMENIRKKVLLVFVCVGVALTPRTKSKIVRSVGGQLAELCRGGPKTGAPRWESILQTQSPTKVPTNALWTIWQKHRMEETKVIYHIDDETTPYLVKIPLPSAQVTLKDFKMVLNKQNSNFKYFFKSMDADFGVVKEEIVDDATILPCFNGRVVSWPLPQ